MPTNSTGQIMMHEVGHDTIAEAVRAAPPVIFTAAWLHGLSISDVVALTTLVYVLLQIGLLAPKYYALWRQWRAR